MMTNGHGRYIEKTWADIENPKKEDERTAEEIASDIINRAGLTLIGEDDESI